MTGERWGSMCRDGWGGAAGHPVPRRLRWLIRLFVARRLGVGGLTGRPRHLRYCREFTGGQQRQGKMEEQRWNRVFAMGNWSVRINNSRKIDLRARARARACVRAFVRFLRINEMRDAILFNKITRYTFTRERNWSVTINDWIKLSSLHSFSRKKIATCKCSQRNSTIFRNFVDFARVIREEKWSH